MKASIGIARELRQRIARGEFTAGDPLPAENELTATLGYSKPVVREALRILETEGLVEIKRGLGGGPRVRRPSISQAAQPIGLYLQLEEAPVMDVWAARDRVVAGAVARLAAAGTDVGALQEQVDALVTHVGDFASFNLQMIRTSEMAVQLSGSLTDYVVVLALRHIIASELAEATQNAAEAVEAAVAAERDIVDAWQRTLRHIQLGQESAARAAFEEQAWTLQALLDVRTPGLSVGDVVSRQLGDLQFEGSAKRTRSPQQEKTAPARRRPRRPGSPARPLRAGPTSGS